MKTRIQNIHTTAGETIRHFLGDTESILFFDIETTGLSPKNASIYLIGAAFLQDKKWTLQQWYAKNMAWIPHSRKWSRRTSTARYRL